MRYAKHLYRIVTGRLAGGRCAGSSSIEIMDHRLTNEHSDARSETSAQMPSVVRRRVQSIPAASIGALAIGAVVGHGDRGVGDWTRGCRRVESEKRPCAIASGGRTSTSVASMFAGSSSMASWPAAVAMTEKNACPTGNGRRLESRA
jgi:hypothetical protein